MVNILIGNRDSKRTKSLEKQLTNDKKYMINYVYSGKDIIEMYWKLNPDILILDSNLQDMSIEEIVNRLSLSPLEKKKCNTILVLPSKNKVQLTDVQKINKIIYKPYCKEQLVNSIKDIEIDYNTPELEVGEVDWLLQCLGFNCMSPGYIYMRDAIIYCYYRPDELEVLKTILSYLAFKHNVTDTKVRDALKGCIRNFNNSSSITVDKELYTALQNNGYGLSLKDFLERIVFYLIKLKNKGRIF